MKKLKFIDPTTKKKIICYLAIDVDVLLRRIKKLSDKPPSKYTCAPPPLPLQRLRDINEMLKINDILK